MQGTLIYCVDDIDTSFVLKDIEMMAGKYGQVIIFSTVELTGKENLPKNVTTIENFMDWKRFRKKTLLSKNIFSILSIYTREVIETGKVLPIKQSMAVICSNIFKANELERYLSKQSVNLNDAVFYSFWFYDCIYLAWLKYCNKTKSIFTRVHGGDLFEERGSLNSKALFRHFQLKYFNRVFSVSRTGTTYLKNKYPCYASRIETSYLGSVSHEKKSPFNGEPFVLVSCAKVRNLKRVHKIAEALMEINFPLTWYHFGDENLSSKKDVTIPEYISNKEKLKQKPNIRYIPCGQMPNEDIYSFYNQNPVNLFISLSSTEGIPVSMMEAISFGIPVMSTDVGGCKEIVTEQTGVLIPLESRAPEVAYALTGFRQSEKNTPEFRKKVREFWESNFNELRNYETFFKRIEETK